MSNPFAINSYNAYNAYQQTAVTNPQIGGGQAGGVWGPSGQPAVEPKVGGVGQQAELNEVAMIGASKRAGFENGLGGTNNPDDHRIFYAA